MRPVESFRNNAFVSVVSDEWMHRSKRSKNAKVESLERENLRGLYTYEIEMRRLDVFGNRDQLSAFSIFASQHFCDFCAWDGDTGRKLWLLSITK